MAFGTADSAESILPRGCSFFQVIRCRAVHRKTVSFCIQRHHGVSRRLCTESGKNNKSWRARVAKVNDNDNNNTAEKLCWGGVAYLDGM